jgi:hypothetical protein
MPEPVTTITLAAVGMAAITEGIKFLYGQASELLKWRHEKHKAAEGAQVVPSEQPKLMSSPDVFEPDPAQASLDEGALERLAQPMGELCDKLSGVVTGRTEVVTSDPVLVMRVDALRKALEVIVGQRLTFRGEARSEKQGPVIRGEVDVKKVLGYAVGVAAGEITGKVTVDGRVVADEVATGASAIGTKVDSVSAPS